MQDKEKMNSIKNSVKFKYCMGRVKIYFSIKYVQNLEDKTAVGFLNFARSYRWMLQDDPQIVDKEIRNIAKYQLGRINS